MTGKACVRLIVASLVAVLSMGAPSAHSAGDRGPEVATTQGQLIFGQASAIDGDTLRVGAAHVRLQGVAAPERGQQGGPQATDYMKRLVNGKAVRCVLDGTRSHDRVVGVCYLNEQDVGAAVISAGLARDCPRFSKGRYASAETATSRLLFFPKYCRPR